MARRLILDTGVLIASERGRSRLMDVIAEDDDLVIAAITVAELRAGVERATERNRAARAAFLGKVLETLPVETYDPATAEIHGQLLAHGHRSGTKRGAHALIIAATASATKRIVLTTDRGALPGPAGRRLHRGGLSNRGAALATRRSRKETARAKTMTGP